MPPKAGKKEAPVERPILGRFSSHLKIGIVGLPNVGKSTLFNTLTKLSIPAENFPFCTIEPNEARVNIPDERFEWLCQLFKPKSAVPAFLEIHDIAGLVKGAHEGQGLGNNFLSHIRAVDGIFHVLRAFEDPDIIHVDDVVDPVRDLEVITAELRLKDIEFMERRIEDLEKSMKRSNDKQLKVEHELCLKVKAWLESEKDIRLGDWKAAEIEILNVFQLLTAKPVVYLVPGAVPISMQPGIVDPSSWYAGLLRVNRRAGEHDNHGQYDHTEDHLSFYGVERYGCEETALRDMQFHDSLAQGSAAGDLVRRNIYLAGDGGYRKSLKRREIGRALVHECIGDCYAVKDVLVNMNEKDYARKKNKFLPKIHAWVQEHGGEQIIPFSCSLERNLADMPEDEAAKYCEENKIQSALPKIIKTGFSAINLIYFFTAGPDEVKCWQIRRQSKAPQAAGAIHTDFERGFICAEVMKFEDLKEHGSESAVKAAGKYKQEGKTYVVQDGDIIFFKFNVSGGGKK
ncbi:OLA1 protein [Tanacetum coccineum]